MRVPVAGQLFVRLDPRAAEPLQAQICASIRRAILDGVLPAGARLPSSRALAGDLGLSRTTTVLAFEQLVAEGYLSSVSGSGTFVTRDLPASRSRPGALTAAVERQPPRISRRGAALASTPTPAHKIPGPPRAFRLGTPALDRVPMAEWTRLVTRRLRSHSITQLDYGAVVGLAALREAIANHMQRARGTSCTPEQVVVVAGAQHGLSLIAGLLIDQGDVAWMEEPGYTGARAALIAAGARVRAIPVDQHGLDVEAGARRAPDAKLVYVTPSHQFPLGVAMSLPRRVALLAWARAAGAWVIEDDYDSEFRYGRQPVACLHGLDADGRVVYVGSFSKSLFPALRLGFLIVPPHLCDAMVGARRASDIHVPTLEQAALADFMISGHYERHLRRMRSEYRARLEAFVESAERLCGGVLRLRPVSTGLHAVADVDAPDAAVFREAVARGVEVMPLSAFCADRRVRPANGIVLGFAAVRPELYDAGFERLAAAIDVARRAVHRRRRA